MHNPMIATVFGASGFIGRYAVKALADSGYVVRAATRDPAGSDFLRPLGGFGEIVPLYAPVTEAGAVRRAVEGADCVVNLVGILDERRRGGFEAVNHQGAATVAREAAGCGVRCLVHVSAIGADPMSDSRYGASKGRGEAAVRKHFPAATILRPSIVFGREDRFFNRFGAMAGMFPMLPVISGETKFQPVYVGDVAQAIRAAAARPDSAGVTYELGGPEMLSFREILQYIVKETGRHRRLVTVPGWAAAIQAAVLQHLPGRLLTPDQLRMLRHDTVVGKDMPKLETLGITPTPIRLVVPDYLRRYCEGGKHAEVR